MFVALGMIESSEVGEMKPYGTIDFHKEGNVDNFWAKNSLSLGKHQGCLLKVCF